MTPSKRIIDLFGGVRAVAKKLNKPVSTVGYWNDSGIPAKHHDLFFDLAKAENVELRREDFFDVPSEQQGKAA